jgi:hypothetical protein
MVDPIGIILFNRYYLHAIEQDENAEAIDLIHDFCESDHSNVMVTGWHGRGKEEEEPQFFGKSLGWLTVNSRIPVLIVKEHIGRQHKKDRAYRFAAVFDGSERSEKSL